MKAVSQILSAPGVLAASLAIAAPRELYGKSIIVNSTEKRIQRDSDEIQFHSAVRRATFSVYVSAGFSIEVQYQPAGWTAGKIIRSEALYAPRS
jgi:hypothetical protein